MGNPKFRLSNVIPNAWFYKLKDMSKTKNSNPSKKNPTSFSTKLSQKPHLSQPKQPYYYTWKSPRSLSKTETPPKSFCPSDFDDHFPDLPRRSSKRRSRRKTIYKPSPRRMATSFAPPNQDCFYQSSSESSFDLGFLIKSPPSEFEADIGDPPELFKGTGSFSSSCSCGFNSSSADITIEVKERKFAESIDKLEAFDTIPVLDLPPILTKPTKSNHFLNEKAANFSISPYFQETENTGSLSMKIVKEEAVRSLKGTTKINRAARKSASPPSGMKLRTNSPKIVSKKNQGQGRRIIMSNDNKSGKCSRKKERFAESFAVVKASVDPERDFRESMMEMIVENNIRASRDLEDLLACYLTLNSNEYHELIIKAFEQIWFSVPDLHL